MEDFLLEYLNIFLKSGNFFFIFKKNLQQIGTSKRIYNSRKGFTNPGNEFLFLKTRFLIEIYSQKQILNHNTLQINYKNWEAPNRYK